jgi:glycosyltransferase involved in cell wall biosynthesis
LLKIRGISIPCYFAGDGKTRWRKKAESLCADLGLGDTVQFLGRVSDLPSLMGRVKFCVLSTHYEGLSLGLIEGMVAGCCAVGSDVEGVREIVRHEHTGYLFPEKDATALANRLEFLLAQEQLAEEVATAGQQHACTTFDKRLMHPAYQTMFETAWAENNGSHQVISG